MLRTQQRLGGKGVGLVRSEGCASRMESVITRPLSQGYPEETPY